MNTRPGTHVLVVDDQSGFRELLKRMLEPAGYEVRTAIDAHAALASIQDSPPAVAILDVHMPGPNGLWLANQIRTASPRTAMVLATSDDAIPPRESLKKGVIAYIVKPLQREAVLKAVSDAFHWFADESQVNLSDLGVPTNVNTTPREDMDGATSASVAHPRSPADPTSRWLALVLAMVVLAAGLALYWQRTSARALERVAAASGAITVEDVSGQPVMQGSGFFVTKDIFVTNHHVIKDGTRARIVMSKGGPPVQVVGLLALDTEHDLALLQTSAPVADALNLNAAMPRVGEIIFVYGAPRGLAGTLSQGIVSAHRVEPDLLQITAAISPGSSGSPVYNADGEVVAVATGSRLDGQGLNFAIPARYVLDLLNTAREMQPLPAAKRVTNPQSGTH